MKWQCLLFDLDGTLVDSERLNCRGYLDLIDEINDDEETLTSRYRGWRFANTIGDIAARYGARIDEDFEPHYRRHVEKLYEQELVANPGVRELLCDLDLPRCVASSAPLAKIERALAITGLDEFFGRNLYSAYDVGAWKPEPDLFLHAADRMQVSPQQCAVIEDSELGIQAGIAAGMQVIYYQPGQSDGVRPDCISVAHFDEIAPYLSSYEQGM